MYAIAFPALNLHQPIKLQRCNICEIKHVYNMAAMLISQEYNRDGKKRKLPKRTESSAEPSTPPKQEEILSQSGLLNPLVLQIPVDRYILSQISSWLLGPSSLVSKCEFSLKTLACSFQIHKPQRQKCLTTVVIVLQSLFLLQCTCTVLVNYAQKTVLLHYDGKEE